MTYREKLYQEHPELASPKIDITRFSCPDSYGYEAHSDCETAGNGCEACWNREMKEAAE